MPILSSEELLLACEAWYGQALVATVLPLELYEGRTADTDCPDFEPFESEPKEVHLDLDEARCLQGLFSERYMHMRQNEELARIHAKTVSERLFTQQPF